MSYCFISLRGDDFSLFFGLHLVVMIMFMVKIVVMMMGMIVYMVKIVMSDGDGGDDVGKNDDLYQ